MPRKKTYLTALLIVCAFTGCSSSLSRSKAAELISKDLASKQTYSHTVSFSSDPQAEIKHSPTIAALYNAGYLEMTTYYYQGPTLFRDSDRTIHLLVLTEKGKEEVSRSGWEVVYRTNDARWLDTLNIPAVSRAEFIEVTGITEKENEATVFYTWRRKPISEIGKLLGYGEKEEGQRKFRKFDDGWRLLD